MKDAYNFYLDHKEDPRIYGRDMDPHLTTSALVLAPGSSRVLMVFHKIFQAWSLPGGHLDGDRDLEASCRREIFEETGLSIEERGQLLDVRYLDVKDHYRRGDFVKSHRHLNFAFFYQLEKTPPVRPKEDENEGVDFLSIKDLDFLVQEAHMLPFYKDLIGQALNLQKRP